MYTLFTYVMSGKRQFQQYFKYIVVACFVAEDVGEGCGYTGTTADTLKVTLSDTLCHFRQLFVQHVFTSGAGTAYHSGAPEITPGFQWGSYYSIFSFLYFFCRSLFVLLYFFIWPLCCLFFDIRMILIAPLVSSNSSS